MAGLPATAPAPALPCWLEVQLDAIAGNAAALHRAVGPHVGLAAVVKAEGYGVGAEEVGRAALQGGAGWLAVARVHEGAELRRAGINAPILVLTQTHLTDADAAVRFGLTVTLDSVELGRALQAAADRHGRRAVVHVKVDTGLHRFGVQPPHVVDLVRAVSAFPGIDVEGIYTHFANADEKDGSFTTRQLASLRGLCHELDAAGLAIPLQHAANSAATLRYPETRLGMVRVGLALYGAMPSRWVPCDVPLEPALALRARIARTLDLEAGECVGYGQTWRASRRTRVGLVLAGYADGVPRRLGNRGIVLVHGQRAPILGRISMDQITVDVTEIPEVGVGSIATLFGRDGEAEIDLSSFAEMAETIPHDILTGIGPRVARVYVQDGAVRASRFAAVSIGSEPVASARLPVLQPVPRE